MERSIKLLLGLCLLIGPLGCASWTGVKNEAIVKGTAVADEIRADAEFSICRGITIGAWIRAYGQSLEKAEAWRVLCSNKIDQLPSP
jgi:hypothetical protein